MELLSKAGIKVNSNVFMKAKVVKQSCEWNLYIEYPLDTMKVLIAFFCEQRILVDLIQMHKLSSGNAAVKVFCLVDREVMMDTLELLRHLPGVLEVEWSHENGAAGKRSDS